MDSKVTKTTIITFQSKGRYFVNDNEKLLDIFWNFIQLILLRFKRKIQDEFFEDKISRKQNFADSKPSTLNYLETI